MDTESLAARCWRGLLPLSVFVACAVGCAAGADGAEGATNSAPDAAALDGDSAGDGAFASGDESGTDGARSDDGSGSDGAATGDSPRNANDGGTAVEAGSGAPCSSDKQCDDGHFCNG